MRQECPSPHANNLGSGLGKRNSRLVTKRDQGDKPKPRKGLGDKLKAWRKRLGVTQVDVAAAIGVHSQVYGDWERGDAAPIAANVRKLAEYFGVPAGEIDEAFSVETKSAEALTVREMGPDYQANGRVDGVDADALRRIIERRDIDEAERRKQLDALAAVIRARASEKAEAARIEDAAAARERARERSNDARAADSRDAILAGESEILQALRALAVDAAFQDFVRWLRDRGEAGGG